MADLTSQLRAMADQTAGRSRPIPADQLISRGNRLRRATTVRRALAGVGAAGVVAAAVLAGTAGSAATGSAPAAAGTTTTASQTIKLSATGSDAAGNLTVTVRYRDLPGNRIRLLAVSYAGHCRVAIATPALNLVFVSPGSRHRPTGSVATIPLNPRGLADFSGSLSARTLRLDNGKSGLASGETLSADLTAQDRLPRERNVLSAGLVLNSLTQP